MFENSGAKIKVVAVVFFWLSTIICIILAFVLGLYKVETEEYVETKTNALFYLLLFGGPFFSYLSSLFIYGFGELIEDQHSIYRSVYLTGDQTKSIAKDINKIVLNPMFKNKEDVLSKGDNPSAK